MCVEVSHLRYVAAAAEHGSFRRAAAALNITQPTLSKRIRELEDRLGIRLFERSTGGAQLTASGEDFVVVAKRVLADLESVKSHAKATQTCGSGRLHVGFYTALAGPLRDAVVSFIQQHPELDLNIVEDNRESLISLLDRGSIDIALVLGEPSYQNYAHMCLWSERIMVAFPKTHPLAEREFVYWTDLKDERFAMSQCDPGSELQGVLLSKLSSPGNELFIKRFKAHESLMMSAVAADCGITLVCESSSTSSLPGLVFREVRDGNGPTRLGFVAYWRRNNNNPALKQFLNRLQTHPAVPNTVNAELRL